MPKLLIEIPCGKTKCEDCPAFIDMELGYYCSLFQEENESINDFSRIIECFDAQRKAEAMEKADLFVRHIEKHLWEEKLPYKVICKICGKNIDDIATIGGKICG